MFTLLLTLLLTTPIGWPPPTPDLRALHWGMTRHEVEEIEHQPVRATDSTLLYRHRWLRNYPASLQLLFAADQLAGVRYLFTPKHSQARQHWNDFQGITAVLSERYGPPTGDYWTWSTARYKNRPDRYGDAVLLGHLTRSSVWETERTIITLEMSGQAAEGIYTVLSYSSKVEQGAN